MLDHERRQVAHACRQLAAEGLVQRTAGNVSVRAGNHVAITPTGARLAELEADQVTVVDLDGNVLDGDLAPTSEAELHLGAYRRFETGAVVHTHAPVATALACVLEEIPCVHYEMLALGGTVRVAPYATFGTPELAAGALDALAGRTAALLANHGTITIGDGLDAALDATRLLEWAANVYWRAASVGAPRTLGDEEREAVVKAALERRYGATQRASAS